MMIMGSSSLIEKIITGIEAVERWHDGLERKVKRRIRKIKRMLAISIAKACLYFFGIGFVITAAIILLAEYVSVEFIFLGLGLIMVYLASLLSTNKQ